MGFRYLVRDQEVDGSNPFAPTIFFSIIRSFYRARLLAVGNPDVFHLNGMLEEPAAFALFGIEPVDLAAFVRKRLLQISHGQGLHRCGAGFIGKAPDGIHVIVLGKRFHQFRHAAGDDVHHASRQIARLEHLIKVSRDKRIFLRGNGNDGVAHGDGGHDQGEESEQWRIHWANDTHRADGFFHRQRNIPEWRIVDRAIELVGPRGVRKNALDAEADFQFRLFLSDDIGQAAGNFFAALRQVFRNIKEHLGTVVRRGLAPSFRLARGFDGVADVLAIAKRRLAEQAAVRRAYFHAVSRIRSRLFAADVKFYGAIDRRGRNIRMSLGRLIDRKRRRANGRRFFKPNGLNVFDQSFTSALAPKPALPIAAKTARSIEKIRAVHPDHARFELCCDVQRNVDALAPDARRQTIDRIVGEFNRFPRRSKRHGSQHRTKDLLLRNNGSRVHVTEQSRQKIKSARRYGDGRLPAGGAFGDALIDETLDALHLHACDDRADVDGLIERRADAQRVHAILNFAD